MHELNGIMIIPTGLDCALGGDAAYMPGVQLISNCANNLIINPNAVNASDINELPSNALYVEGSTIDRFLEGKLNLRKTKTFNKILMAVNSPVGNIEQNCKNAAIWGLGADVEMVELKTPLVMKAEINADGTAGGTYSGVSELVKQLSNYEYDALAIQTKIDIDPDTENHYWKHGGVNPWGGIEAIVSKDISQRLNKPLAHGPTGNVRIVANELIVEKTMAPEAISISFMFCVFKGLHRAPRLELDITKTGNQILSRKDIDFFLTPHGCWGRPHEAASNLGIPIIVVEENTTCFSNGFTYPENKHIINARNYLEAAGIISSMSAGIDYKTVVLD